MAAPAISTAPWRSRARSCTSDEPAPPAAHRDSSSVVYHPVVDRSRKRRSIMTTDLIHTDATELAELIRTGRVSSVEVVQAHLDRIEAINPKLNAVVTLADGALDAARAADEKLAAG